MPKLEPYSRKLDYSYALGVFPALMLMEARPGIAGEWACYHDRSNYYWAFVAGKKEEEAGLYAVRRGVVVSGISGEIEDAPAVQDAQPFSAM